jgi:hypothetical protein
MSRYAERIAAPRAKAAPTRQRTHPVPLPRPSLSHVLQLRAAQSARAAAAPAAAGRSGLPAPLKAGIEQLSGIAMDDVRVHRNSTAPAKLGALAYAQGSDIHLGPGQERHLPHEAWHVVQQKQGRVKPTLQMKGVGVNEDGALEREADRFGEKAVNIGSGAATDAPAPRAAADGAPVRQLKKLAAPAEVKVTAQANNVYFNDGVKSVGEYWETKLVTERPARATLLTAMATNAAALGTKIDALSGKKWIFNRDNSEDTIVKAFNPVRVRFKGKYEAAQQKKDLDLEYHFGDVWSGYVVHVRDAGRTIDKEMHDPNAGQVVPQGKYSNKHDDEPQVQSALENRGNNADAVTKIAGEGARWQAIAANAGRVRDATRFFTNERADGAISGDVRYVTFPTLWKSWVSTFSKAYGIGDDVVATKLQEQNFVIGTGDSKRDSPVKTDKKMWALSFANDISVDRNKPTQPDDLVKKTAAFAEFKKSGASVTLSQETLTQQITAATEAMSAKATYKGAGGYLGGEVFVFLCSWDQPPNGVAGYTYQGINGVALDYPAYRDSDSDTLAKVPGAPRIGDGPAKYAAEQKVVYDSKITARSQELAVAIAQMPKGKKQKLSDADIQDLEPKRVMTAAYPWEPGDSIPSDLLTKVWTTPDLLDLAAAYVTRRQTRRKEELDKKMKPYANLPFKDQNAHKKRIRAELERDIK